jgi:glutamate--cysteine ligase
MQRDFAGSHIGFIRAQADQTRNHLLGLPWSDAQQEDFETAASASIARRVALELADKGDFETFRQAYLAPERLQA